MSTRVENNPKTKKIMNENDELRAKIEILEEKNKLKIQVEKEESN